MFKKWQQHPIFWFYLLSIYVVLQFIWWGILIVRLTADKYEGADDISSRIWMVAGEGLVFLIILFVGVWQVRKSFMKEIKLSRQQNNFLLSVSHELKTPLSSIKLYLQTLRSRKLNKEKSEEVIGFSLEETERLHNMIDNILTASKMEYSGFELYHEKFDASSFITTRIQQLEAGIGRNHQTKIEVHPRIEMTSDKSALTSILNNLYENAVKYSEKGTEIKITFKREEQRLVLAVKDEGIGVSKSVHKEVFKKFYREGNEDVRKTKGTGLGLYIVQNLVELIGGIIEVSSPEDSNRGTIFKIIWKEL